MFLPKNACPQQEVIKVDAVHIFAVPIPKENFANWIFPNENAQGPNLIFCAVTHTLLKKRARGALY